MCQINQTRQFFYLPKRVIVGVPTFTYQSREQLCYRKFRVVYLTSLS